MDNLSTIILAASLVIIMLGMGLSLTLADFKRVLLYPKAILIGIINQIVLLPLIGFGLVSVLDVPPEIAIGIMILAACPGGPTSNLISHLAKADLALSVTLTAMSSLITIITIPFIINFSLIHFVEEGQMIQLNVLETIAQILIIVVIPISIGMVIKDKRDDFAKRMAKPVRVASGFVLALVILGIILKEKDNFISYFEQAGHAALVLNILTMAAGYFTAKWAKLPLRQMRSISIESGIQNGTLAITIAVVLLDSSSYAIAPAVYSLIMFVTGAAVIWMGNRSTAEE
ncbi:MAG: bile acid:sodium symporter family protein [Bacteroidia bacterium]